MDMKKLPGIVSNNAQLNESINECGDMVQQPQTPPVTMSVNLNAQGVDNIKELLGIELRLGMGSNLLARNYYQVNKSESVLAVAYLTGDFKSVSGGTRMAVDLGVALGLPVYVLDVTTEDWFMYDYNQAQFVQFKDVPPLSRKFTAVGTRDIEDYNIKDRDSGLWVSRPQFVGHDKSRRIIAKMEDVFKLATRN